MGADNRINMTCMYCAGTGVKTITYSAKVDAKGDGILYGHGHRNGQDERVLCRCGR